MQHHNSGYWLCALGAIQIAGNIRSVAAFDGDAMRLQSFVNIADISRVRHGDGEKRDRYKKTPAVAVHESSPLRPSR